MHQTQLESHYIHSHRYVLYIYKTLLSNNIVILLCISEEVLLYVSTFSKKSSIEYIIFLGCHLVVNDVIIDLLFSHLIVAYH